MILNEAGVRAIMLPPVLKKKPLVKPRSKGAPRPSKETLDLFLSTLKEYGPITSQKIQCVMDITKPFMFTCARYLKADGVIQSKFPNGKGPGKQVYYSLVESVKC